VTVGSVPPWISVRGRVGFQDRDYDACLFRAKSLHPAQQPRSAVRRSREPEILPGPGQDPVGRLRAARLRGKDTGHPRAGISGIPRGGVRPRPTRAGEKREQAPLLLAVLATVLALITPVVTLGQPPGPENIQDLWLLDAQGARVSCIEALAPGPTLVIFWRLDSKPSREAVIHLHQNRLRLETRVNRVVGITDERQAATHDFLRSQGIRFPTFCDPERRLASAYGIGYVFPSLLLLDEDLMCLGREEGGGASFDAKLRRLLEESLPKDDEPGHAWIVIAALAAVAILGVIVSR
jgi:hypothetical protein